jgi:hypothetical protein
LYYSEPVTRQAVDERYTDKAVAFFQAVFQLGHLYRLRWQIELVFKQFKSVLRLDWVVGEKVQRLLCEVWARLTAAVLSRKNEARTYPGLFGIDLWPFLFKKRPCD